MAELKDGSLLFSLGTWMVRERQRQALERAEAARAEALAEAEHALRERRRLEADLRRERENARAQRRERERLEAEARRLELFRRSELERAVREAAARSALELDALRRDHEERLRAIRLSTTRLRERVVAGSVVLCLVSAALGLVLFHAEGPGAELARTRSELEPLLALERARAAQAERVAAAALRRERALAGVLARCTEESGRPP